MTFEQATALGKGWAEVQVAVLDGHDRRCPHRREQAACDAGVPALAPHDNFVGVRVATFTRAVLTPESFSPPRGEVDWPAHGYTSPPDIAAAIRAIESSPAGAMLLTDEPHHRHPEHE